MDELSQQVVLRNVGLLSMIGVQKKSPWEDTLFIPPFAVAASITILLVQAITTSGPVKRLRARISNANEESSDLEGPSSDPPPVGLIAKARAHIDQHGGIIIFSNNLVRLAGTLVLLGLSAINFLGDESAMYKMAKESPIGAVDWARAAMFITFGYTSLLSFLSLTARPSIARVLIKHLVSVHLVVFGVYAFRDLWPFATFDRSPADAGEGWVMWLQIVILTLISVVIPLVIPREYVPVDPKDPTSEPNIEQTTSVLSLVLYSFLDPLIYLAYKVPHLAASALPPIADYDKAKNLMKKSFPVRLSFSLLEILDPLRERKKGHIFWGILIVFRREYTILALMLVIKVISDFASPVGINRLLNYLEQGGKGQLIRPWVWIAWLVVGPTVGSIAFQWYIYIATRTLVRVEGILTQLIFEHALRIRMKAETNDTLKEATENAVVGAETPVDSPSVAEESAYDSSSSTSGDETLQASSVSGTSTATTAAGKQKAKDKDGKTPAEEPTPKLSASGKNLVGKINSLVTTDVGNITDAKDFLMIVVEIPLQVSLAIWFLYRILGWSALVGMGVTIALFPVPGYITKLMQGVEREAMKRTDARVQSVTETMSVLRMVKMFGWERKMEARVAEKREEELKWVWKRKVLNLINNVINHIIPALTMIATFSFYTLVMKQELNASRVFSSMTVFDMIRNQLGMILRMMSSMVQGKVSLDRVNDFLHKTELLDSFAEKKSNISPFSNTNNTNEDNNQDIGLRAASFTWSNNTDGTLTPSKREFCLRVPDEVIFKRGCINLIVGPTGSGKTSMLMALLGEMHFIPLGENARIYLPRQPGGVAYAAQESWVQNETIRENIVFGAPFDEVRYNKVLHQCGLERDLSLFEAGDQTEVGEKGLTLSGGQKARITLARAVYSSADVLLLDDILAALDVHTSRWVVEKCLTGELMRGRTVLLVAHNIAMTGPIADLVVSIGSNGAITVEESASKILANNQELAVETSKSKDANAKAQQAIDVPHPDETAATGGKLTVKEEIPEGHVSMSSVTLLTKAMGGQHPFVFWLIAIGGVFLTELAETVQTWFLGYWASQYEKFDHSEVNVPFYLTIYSLFTVFVLLWFVIYRVAYFIGSLRASKSIHKDLVNAVLGTTLRWLDTTPTSRVIARCTQDIKAVDNRIPNMLSNLVYITVLMIVQLGAVVALTPVFLIPGIFITIVGSACGQVYMRAQLSVKREMSNARAPVIAHFGAAIAGLTSIRAYGAQRAFQAESLSRIDRYTRTARMFYNFNRWISIRIDALGGFFAAALAAYLVYGRGESTPANTGFSLTMAVSFASLILWWVRSLNEFEVSGNSLERIRGYIDIEQEAKPTEGGDPPAYWPASGDLVVENLSARYSQDGQKVLHDISFEIKSGERVGVVGRTGSGKSSLTLSLLRCIYTDGTVYFGGIPTSSVNLDALRSSITIIPQIPELLSGTLRANLDPFSQYDDAALNDALRSAGLSALQMEAEDNRLTLDTEISSGGGNLSVGQRQILALARAILRGSKLLILDEATSAIDYKTDTVIQSSLRQELGSDVSVITVAHRLQTIMDADKIMVLDTGRIVEFDSPRSLLQKEGGLLRALVDESGDREALYAMAGGKANSLM